MSLWGNLKDAISNASEQAHAERLRRDVEMTLRRTDSLADELKKRVVEGFLSRRALLLTEIDNWSTEGRLKVARELFGDARREMDFNVVGSLERALAALWLESGERRHTVSATVHRALNLVAEQWRLEQSGERLVPSAGASSPPALRGKTAAPDWYDHIRAVRAKVDKQQP